MWAKDRARFTAREGVVFIGVAQEKMRSFKARRRQGQGRTTVFDFSPQSVAVNHYYFCRTRSGLGPDVSENRQRSCLIPEALSQWS